MRIEVTSLEATQKFAQLVADKIFDLANSGSLRTGVILLFGELGSGKTTFVSSLAKSVDALGDVMSPTFVLQRKLRLSPSSKLASFFDEIVHIDAYRFDTPDEAKIFNLEKAINMPPTRSLYLIEWPEKLGEIVKLKGDNAPYSIKFTHPTKGQSENIRFFETDIIDEEN